MVKIDSNRKEQMLYIWLKNNYNELCNNPTKTQIFLLFYELFSKVEKNSSEHNINQEHAKKAAFLCSTTKEKELLELTHNLEEFDSKEKGTKFVRFLLNLNTIEYIDNTKIVNIEDKYFLFSKEDFSKLGEQQYDVLSILASKEDLENPVYAEIDEKGRILITE